MPWWHLQCAKGTGGEKGELRKLLTQGQVDDVRERAKITRDAAEKAIRAAWTHLLYAVQPPDRVGRECLFHADTHRPAEMHVAVADAVPYRGCRQLSARHRATGGNQGFSQPLAAIGKNGGEDGIRTHETLLRSAPLAGACLRPLGHLSVAVLIGGNARIIKRFSDYPRKPSCSIVRERVRNGRHLVPRVGTNSSQPCS